MRAAHSVCAATIAPVSHSQRGPVVDSFALTRWQRVQWSAGSPVRAIGFACFTALLSWLGFVSIGMSAVLAIVVMVCFAHWVPFALAGRSRLGISSHGITDHLRFRTHRYAWEEISALKVMTLHRSTHGLVVELVNQATGTTRTEFLRSSWRPSPEQARHLLGLVRGSDKFRADLVPAALPSQQ